MQKIWIKNLLWPRRFIKKIEKSDPFFFTQYGVLILSLPSGNSNNNVCYFFFLYLLNMLKLLFFCSRGCQYFFYFLNFPVLNFFFNSHKLSKRDSNNLQGITHLKFTDSQRRGESNRKWLHGPCEHALLSQGEAYFFRIARFFFPPVWWDRV